MGETRQQLKLGHQALVSAIEEQNLQLVKTCVERGSDVNYTPLTKKSPLAEAVVTKNLEIIRFLIGKGADVNDRGRMQHAPLFIAIDKEISLDVVKILVDSGANVNDTNAKDDTPLTKIIRKRNTSVSKFLVERGADVNKIGSGKTPLSMAAMVNDFEAFKVLMEYGADPEKKNSDGSNAVDLAKKLNLEEFLTYLQAHFTSDNKSREDDVNGKNFIKLEDLEGCTPLGQAVLSGNLQEMKRLISIGVDTCEIGTNGKSPLYLAVLTKNLATIKLLLDNGAELTINTAFLESIERGYTDIAVLLLEREVLVHLVLKNGYTPLTKAVEKENFEVVRALLAKRADVNMVDRLGNSPLIIALRKQNKKMTSFLISRGAKLDKVFLEENDFENLVLLRLMSIQLNDVVKDNNQLLIKAVLMKNLRMVKFFLKEGIKVDQRGDDKKTALATAASLRCFGIVKSLMDSGANVKWAEKEMEEFAASNEDFDIYFQSLKISKKL